MSEENSTLRVFDENDNELNRDELDLEHGYLALDRHIKEHHEAVEPVQGQEHYEVKTFYFEDGSSLTVESQDDPHIRIINEKKGQFGYVDQGEGKVLKGIDLVRVVDIETVPGKEAWDEEEDIERYYRYTESEYEAMVKERELNNKWEMFKTDGIDRVINAEKAALVFGDDLRVTNLIVDDLNLAAADSIEESLGAKEQIDDLTLLIAEMIGE